MNMLNVLDDNYHSVIDIDICGIICPMRISFLYKKSMRRHIPLRHIYE